MLKFETHGQGDIKTFCASGNFAEIATEVSMFISLVYGVFDEYNHELSEEFKRALLGALQDDKTGSLIFSNKIHKALTEGSDYEHGAACGSVAIDINELMRQAEQLKREAEEHEGQ